jgi:hypothetical protein
LRQIQQIQVAAKLMSALVRRLKELEREVIAYCKANPQIRIIEAIDVLLKQEIASGSCLCHHHRRRNERRDSPARK